MLGSSQALNVMEITGNPGHCSEKHVPPYLECYLNELCLTYFNYTQDRDGNRCRYDTPDERISQKES